MNALIVVDMQNGCFERPRLDTPAVVGRINELARAFRKTGLVVWIQHTDPAEGFARDSHGWQLLDTLEVAPADATVTKEACDSFLETDLNALLKARGVDSLVICGCATDFCVDTTVRSATSHGYAVSVASDAHTTADRPHLEAAAIIAHHNYMWAELLLPRGRKVRVAPTLELLKEVL